MKNDFLASLLGSQSRARLLRTFIFDAEREFSLAELSKRAGVSPRAATRELKSLEKLGLIKKSAQISITMNNASKRSVSRKRNVEVWSLEKEARNMQPLSRFVHEVSPMKHESILKELRRCGKLSVVVLSGTFMGDPTRPADVLVAGEDVSAVRLDAAMKRLETTLGREIRYAHFPTAELRYRMTVQDRLVRDTLDFPHVILLDKVRLF